VWLVAQAGVPDWLVAILGACVLLVDNFISNFFHGMTAYLIFGYLAEGDGRLDRAFAAVRRNIAGIFLLSVLSTIVEAASNWAENRDNPLAGMIVGLIERLWTIATFLVLPAIVIENLDLGQSLRRTTEIVRGNLLLIGVGEVGVRTVTWLVGVLLGIGAVALGFVVAFGLAQANTLAGLTPGLVIAGTLLMAIITLAKYIQVAYYTSLFLWARSVEHAVERHEEPSLVPAPAPLAAVLSS
jgi:hypothetical protein